MVNRSQSDPLDAALAHLGSLEPRDEQDRAEIEQTIVSIVRIRSRRNTPTRKMRVQGKLVPVPQSKPTPVAAAAPVGAVEDSPFYGLGLQLAAPKQLQIAGKPQLPREIWEALSGAGYQSAHNDPVSAVRNALKRRMQTHADVFLVGEGKWARKDFYTEAELVEIRKSIGGMGGRDRAAHSERTKAGMIVARSRGALPGKPPKLTQEQWATIESELARGVSASVLADQYDVSRQTIYNKFNREAIQQLRSQHTQSHPLGEETDAPATPRPSPLRVVK